MTITITEAAARHVQKFIDNRGKGVGIRLGVRTSGCSGMAYQMEFADEIAEELALPPVKVHCSVLAEDAIKAAIKDYADKKQD